jgi:membrane-associated phospholipid phosphatase
MIGRLSKNIKKFWAQVALLSAEMIIVILLFAIALVAFIFISRNIFILKEDQFDYRVFDYLKPHVSDRNNAIMLFFTFLGTHIFLIPANMIVIFIFLFIKKHRWYSLKIPVIALSSLALMFLLKNIFNRPRPDIPLLREAKGLSFPSGHAFMSVTFYGLLIYIIWKTVRTKWLKLTLCIFLLLLILIIGFTRIYLRVHYPSDVLAGFATGFLWLAISIYIMNKIEKFSRRKLSPLVEAPPVATS